MRVSGAAQDFAGERVGGSIRLFGGDAVDEYVGDTGWEAERIVEGGGIVNGLRDRRQRCRRRVR